MWWLVGIGMAAPSESDRSSAVRPAEEVVVYGSPWRRWDGTRWLVGADLLLPSGMQFQLDRNLAFTSHLFQVRGVFACDLDGEPGKKRAEVGCVCEDVAIQATSLRDGTTEDQRQRVEQVLLGLDAEMTGMVVELQVDDGGGVQSFNLEGMTADGERERLSTLALTDAIGRMVSGFHLRIPDENAAGGQWTEYHSALMNMPGLTGSRGSSTVVHAMGTSAGQLVLQSVGEGSTSVELPNYARNLFPPPFPGASTPDKPKKVQSGESIAPMGVAGDGGPKTYWEGMPALVPGRVDGNTTMYENTYELQLAGVGVVKDGVLTERVWVVVGKPTASAMGGPMYIDRGRLRLLGPDDHPDLGPTRQVAYPGADDPFLPPWQDMQ